MTDQQLAEIVNALCEIAKVPADHLVEAIRHWRESTDTFCAWAQPYLDSSRWGGHDMLDAIRVELTERDAEVERLKALNRASAERLWDEAFYATVEGWTIRSAFSGTTPTDTEHAAAHRQRKEAIDRLMIETGNT